MNFAGKASQVYNHTGYFRLAAIEVFKKQLKIPPAMALGTISRKWFQRGSQNFMHLSWTISPTNLLDMTSLTVSSQLKNAIKYCTKVRKMGLTGQKSQIIRPLFNQESSNFAWTSTMTKSTAVPDMTSPATSSRQ